MASAARSQSYPHTRDDRSIVATDASVGHRRGTTTAGLAWVRPNGTYGVTTTRTAIPLVGELAAIGFAASTVPGTDPLHLLSDCQIGVHLIQRVLRTGRIDLPAGTHGSSQVAAACSRLLLIAQRRPLSVSWVRGHAGDPLNEAADRLAVQARRCVQNGGRLPAIRALTDRIATEVPVQLRQS